MNSNQNIAIYPGTFDPITNGHLDIIQRALPLFDRVIITLAVNSNKKPMFSIEERLDMISESIKHLEGAEVVQFSGLVVDFGRKVGAKAVIRGLRAVSDFEYEFQIALMNRKLWNKMDTVFLMPDEKYTYLSSRIVREVAKHGGAIDYFVPKYVNSKLRSKINNLNK